jgi:hypothetical protein
LTLKLRHRVQSLGSHLYNSDIIYKSLGTTSKMLTSPSSRSAATSKSVETMPELFTCKLQGNQLHK